MLASEEQQTREFVVVAANQIHSTREVNSGHRYTMNTSKVVCTDIPPIIYILNIPSLEPFHEIISIVCYTFMMN